jgi:hypothetical protein
MRHIAHWLLMAAALLATKSMHSSALAGFLIVSAVGVDKESVLPILSRESANGISRRLRDGLCGAIELPAS